MSQMSISMPEPERQAFIEAMGTVEDQANTYTDQCIKILVEEHNATEAGIKRDIFYLAAVYHLVSGNPLPEPEIVVKEALGMYRAGALGLGGAR